MSDSNGNGNTVVELPASRKAAVAQAAEHYQELYQQNENLCAEVAALKTELAGYKISLEVLTAQRNEADSKAATAMITVDEHKAARMEYESLFIAIAQLMKVFRVPAAPLIRELQQIDDAPSTIGGA